MNPIKRLGGSTVRFALVYLALFGLSTSAVLGFVYTTSVGVIDSQTDHTIEAEITGLAEHYRQNGLIGLTEIVTRRSRGSPGRRNMYLVTDPRFAPVAGNLSRWPNEARDGPGWIDFLVETKGGTDARPQVARARIFFLADGFHLLVGRDTTERSAFRKRMTEALLGALALSVALGAAGGLLMGRHVLRRIDAINRTSRGILGGDLKRRVPIGGSGDEFDQLAHNLNAMLDRIAGLMSGMREVANGIAHDLRSPISRLRARLEVTLLGKADPEVYRHALQETIAETDTILETFNALLAISLAESRALRDEFAEIDLASLATDAVELYQPLAEEKGQRVSLEIEAGLVTLGNHSLLSQAVANLLDNAVKYTPAGGTVSIIVRPGIAGPEIAVADDGPGIPSDFRQKALRRFTRLEASRQAPGSGLGLSLVAAVAELHDATLHLEDNGPGLRAVLRFAPRLGSHSK
ncbi:MAG: HAMP domain-containing sensor histidine kinase [Rhodospirillales bacterium]|nr:HAMP domain-containing sensor histidine kinase [Rhodospirillales bacterium]MDP7650694.1 HAMP domain-containing sensor histidine kinase [Rhodospirillales bacterium]HJO98017.1 HAMP domain-containing sensor histidine kinase [Rhodospirillales bacterium]